MSFSSFREVREVRERERDKDKDRSCEKSLLLQRSFLFLGWCCVTNLMGTAPSMKVPEACLGSGPFIGFLIGGSAVKRLTSLACFLAALPPMKCTRERESGGCGPQVTEILESFQHKNT